MGILAAWPALADEPTFRPEDVRLALTDISPEQVVTITGEDGDFAVYLMRDADGDLVLEWGEHLGDAWFYSDRDLILVTNLPPGDYVIRSWLGQARVVGKTYFSGVGVETGIMVGDEMVEASLALGNASAGHALAIYGLPPDAPNGVAIFIDGEFVGTAFDSAEAHLSGLTAGAHEIRLEAPGYEPFVQTVTVSDVTTPLFARFMLAR